MDGNGRQRNAAERPNGVERVERMNRAAEAEKGPDDPQAVEPRNTVPLVVLVCAAVVIAIGVIGAIYVRDHDGTRSVPVAQSQNEGQR
jgi:hypothetical protein